MLYLYVNYTVTAFVLSTHFQGGCLSLEESIMQNWDLSLPQISRTLPHAYLENPAQQARSQSGHLAAICSMKTISFICRCSIAQAHNALPREAITTTDCNNVMEHERREMYPNERNSPVFEILTAKSGRSAEAPPERHPLGTPTNMPTIRS